MSSFKATHLSNYMKFFGQCWIYVEYSVALQLNHYVTDRKQCQRSVKMCLLCLGEFSTPNVQMEGEVGGWGRFIQKFSIDGEKVKWIL